MQILPVPATHPDALRLVEEVQEEYVVLYGSPDQSPVQAEQFAGPVGAFFVGYLEGEPVATGAWRRHAPHPDLSAVDVVEVKRMFVVRRVRGRGLAREVLAHLEASARLAGHDGVVLETGLQQPEAIGLYLSSGYSAIAGFGHYRGSPLSRCFGKLLA